MGSAKKSYEFGITSFPNFTHHHKQQTLITKDMDITDLLEDGQNLGVYNCEYLEILRHYKSFALRKLFKTRSSGKHTHADGRIYVVCC
jgi:hypothetical protein